MANLIEDLRKIEYDEVSPKVLVDGGDYQEEYDRRRQVFNLKFQYRPTAIVLCTCSEHVSEALKITERYGAEIRVRSGGHDHEGECSGTDTVVIDLSNMNKLSNIVDRENGVVRVPPGARFKAIVPIMNKANIGIPHGTCGTVGIAGFTFGGGWGPWTRQKGMCCESLVGATIVLGDGTIRELDIKNKDDWELLWALRGGGGMSYGIVTELVIKTFELPPETIKFSVTWKDQPAIQVLEHWENMIVNDQGPELLGTNLKIAAIPKTAAPCDSESIRKSVHDCVFYGYYAGTEETLNVYLNRWFGDLGPVKPDIYPDNADNTEEYVGFSAWDRSEPIIDETADMAFYIPPDADEPAPHKITCRLVKKGLDGGGLSAAGRESLICSLESELLHEEGEKQAGVHCYVTLGAITGPYYKNYNPADHPLGSAFAYKERPYTIQYQAWWNESEADRIAGRKYNVDRYINQAEDWIAECREREFAETLGSFISFKDSNVPTWKYFLETENPDDPEKEKEIYNRLKEIKQKYSKDPKNRLRTRKTII